MFETSFLLCLKTIGINIFVPLIVGILFLRLCFGKKFQGMLLYLLGWFIGVGVIAFSLFNIQFIHFGIGIQEYSVILAILIIGFILKLIIQKSTIGEYLKTLKIKNIYTDLQQSFVSLSKVEKIFTIIISIFSFGFIITSFISTTHFPTYGDDSFGNWNTPAYNIYQDGGVKIFGEKEEILGRGRLGYPIYVPIYKATIVSFLGGFNDIYINMWQWLVFIGMLGFVFSITFERTKNIFYSVLPIGLIISLPLVFFHTGEGYMELASGMYAILAIWSFWSFLQKKEYAYISLGLLFGFILSYIKNDGFIVYVPGILATFVIILLIEGTLKEHLLGFIKKGYNILLSGFYFVFFFLPFLIVKSYYNLGFNQAAGAESGIGISSKIHREIFSVFDDIFTKIDNYNVVLIVIAVSIRAIIKKRKSLSSGDKFLIYTPLAIFMVLMLVFLLTENYLFALNQTTINRVFTIVFVLFFSFSGYIFAERGND